MKQALIYDPYLDTLGGGERYTFSFVEFLLNQGWKVDVLWSNKNHQQELISRLNLKIQNATFINKPSSRLQLWQLSKQYNACFWLSDGSIPFLLSGNNILHFQVPFHDLGGYSLLNQLKLKTINHVVCNSQFTQKFIDREYQTHSQVIYPPVETAAFKPGQKENYILSVGRFSQLLQSKRQDVLIKAFINLFNSGLKNWRLVIAGATGIGGDEYFTKLQQLAKGYPIELVNTPSFTTLQQLYARAKIFWYAAGYEIDETQEPEKVEHFGITTVEAMSAGCVPLVHAKGGPKEVIIDGQNGYLWKNLQNLSFYTQKLILNHKLLNTLSYHAQLTSSNYSKEKFNQHFNKII